MASVAASIRAGFYTIGLAGGVESMSLNPMAWEGGVNPKIESNPRAQSCLLPMGMPLLFKAGRTPQQAGHILLCAGRAISCGLA